MPVLGGLVVRNAKTVRSETDPVENHMVPEHPVSKQTTI